MLKPIKGSSGSALVVTLLMLIMLSFIGIASITTSVRDMDIAKNTKDRTEAFYVAEAGLELAHGILKNNANVFGNDTLLGYIAPYTTLANGMFNIYLAGTSPYKTVTSTGRTSDGQAAVQVVMRRRRSAMNIWNNVMFAGSGKQGKAVAGNVAYHGPIHILGEGEPFTDLNANGVWDQADQFTDNNGNGAWDIGEPLTSDADGDGIWDPAEPFQDDNGNNLYDGTLTATDLATDMTGTAGMYNNYSGMPANIFSRVPALELDYFGGENVYTLEAELRVKHGVVNLSGNAKIGQPDQSGGSPQIKETIDGAYVSDGWGGSQGSDNVYSDNGHDYGYDLGDALEFPSIKGQYTDPYTGISYADYSSWLAANSLVIPGDVTLRPGTSYGGGASSYGSISMDNYGNLSISGIVFITGDVRFEAGYGGYGDSPILYNGRGTVVSGGDMHINTHVLSSDQFPTDDVLGFLSTKGMYIGTGSGASQLDMMGAFFAQNEIFNAKQNHLAGAMVSNYFQVKNVPHMYFVPAIVDNLPPGMPGSGMLNRYTYVKVPGTWREL
jgi:hypothetical protein